MFLRTFLKVSAKPRYQSVYWEKSVFHLASVHKVGLDCVEPRRCFMVLFEVLLATLPYIFGCYPSNRISPEHNTSTAITLKKAIPCDITLFGINLTALLSGVVMLKGAFISMVYLAAWEYSVKQTKHLTTYPNCSQCLLAFTSSVHSFCSTVLREWLLEVASFMWGRLRLQLFRRKTAWLRMIPWYFPPSWRLKYF